MIAIMSSVVTEEIVKEVGENWYTIKVDVQMERETLRD